MEGVVQPVNQRRCGNACCTICLALPLLPVQPAMPHSSYPELMVTSLDGIRAAICLRAGRDNCCDCLGGINAFCGGLYHIPCRRFAAWLRCTCALVWFCCGFGHTDKAFSFCRRVLLAGELADSMCSSVFMSLLNGKIAWRSATLLLFLFGSLVLSNEIGVYVSGVSFSPIMMEGWWHRRRESAVCVVMEMGFNGYAQWNCRVSLFGLCNSFY